MMATLPLADRPPSRRASGWRAHSVITTMLLILLAALIVRDLFARRWGAPAQPSSNVTQRPL